MPQRAPDGASRPVVEELLLDEDHVHVEQVIDHHVIPEARC